MAILEVRSLNLSFGGLRVLQDVSFSVEARTITSLVGPNGAGKTSVFNVISRLLRPLSGEVRFEGRRLDTLRPDQVARRGIGRMFQDPRIFPGMTVFENALSGARLRGNDPWHALIRDSTTRQEWHAAIDRIGHILDELGLGQRLQDEADSLSFAEQRFLSFARCLAGEPRLLLLDEPTVGLDARSIDWLIERMRHLVESQGMTIVLVEHNMDVVLTISNCVHLLVQGQVVASGPTAEIRQHAKMIEAYLGDRYVASDS
jgi:branched-chain amino acid transport system ATP-binding protein